MMAQAQRGALRMQPLLLAAFCLGSVLLLLLSSSAVPANGVETTRLGAKIFSNAASSGSGSRVHATKHVRELRVLEGFRVTHPVRAQSRSHVHMNTQSASATASANDNLVHVPLRGFHPDAPPALHPHAERAELLWSATQAANKRSHAVDALSALTNEQRARLDEIDDMLGRLSERELKHWTVAGPPHRFHRPSASTSTADKNEDNKGTPLQSASTADIDADADGADFSPEDPDSLPQLFPSRIRMHLPSLFDDDDDEDEEEDVLDLHLMANLFEPGARVEVLDERGEVVSSTPHTLQSYWSRSPDGSGWATATLHADGRFQAVVHRGGDTIQIDPVELHKQEMPSERHWDALHRAAHHRHQERDHTAGRGLVYFRHSDMEDTSNTHRCAGLRHEQEGALRSAGTNTSASGALWHEEPLLPYTASARKLLQTSSATTQGYGNFPTATLSAKIASWSSCFSDDSTTPLKLSVGFAVDAGMYAVWGSAAGVSQYIAWQMSVANLIYLPQVHIFLSLSDIVIASALGAGTPAWNDAPPSPGSKCPISIQTKLNTFSSWRGTAKPTSNAVWQLQTNCYPPAGTVGLAWIGVLCNSYYATSVSTFSSNQWLTSAHEIGHNFGAQHTFQLGQGATGGIMDYGDGRLDGLFQFNTVYSQAEVCAEVRATQNQVNLGLMGSMAPFCLTPFVASCGNGVVEPGEECDDTSACCGSPSSSNACKLTSGSQCSGETPCCTQCKFKPSSTTCMGGSGLCQNGFCAASSCQGYSSLSYCGVEPGNPCRQRCQSSATGGTCSSAYTSPNLAVGDGVVCRLEPYSLCQAGACVEATAGATKPTYSWTTSAWSTCSCAGGQTRVAYCTGSDGSLGTEGSDCLTSTKPALSQTCAIPASCTTYAWVRSDTWTSCSADCGSGLQQATVSCISSSSGAPVAESSCTGTKPASTRACNEQACPLAWNYGEWGACSVGCGGGVSTRSVTCVRTQNGLKQPVEAAQCTSAAGAAQASSQVCNTDACVPGSFWLSYGAWGACSASCGGGVRSRPATCSSTDGEHDLSNCGCGGATSCPGTEESCNTHVCPEYTWNDPAWGSCSAQCGGGFQTRTIQCVDKATGVATADSNCAAATKPPGLQDCNTDPCVAAKWAPDNTWSSCSKTCGGGVQTRAVRCVDGSGTALSDSVCAKLSGVTKPPSQQVCNAQACPTFQWLLSDWSTCSSWCGGGTQSRSVKCTAVGSLTPVAYSNCDTSSIPATARYCNTEIQCPLDSDVQWQLADWTSCSSICGGLSVKNRTVICRNTTTGLEVDSKFCPNNYAPEASALCPDVKCPTYWHTEPWSTCTAACNGGTQQRAVSCRYVDSQTGESIDDSLCTGTRPAEQADCNRIPCPSWQVGDWGACSERCGDGVQIRPVSCVSWDNQNVSASACAASPLPQTSRACNLMPCPHWHRGPWSLCDRPCGGGQQTRPVSCRMPHASPWNGQLVEDESLCPAEGGSGDPGDGVGEAGVEHGKPLTQQSCNTDACAAYYWDTNKWGSCSSSCGVPGVQTGASVCRSSSAASAEDIRSNPDAGVVESSRCSASAPTPQRACNPDPCPKYAWVATSDWSNCTVQCGSGVQRRSVRCANTNPPSWTDTPFEVMPEGDDSACAGMDRLPEVQPCSFPDSVCYGSSASSSAAPNGMCTSEGKCLCRAGWAGDYCTSTPRIFNVLTNGPSYSEGEGAVAGMPLGDVLQISWQSEGSMPYVSLLIHRVSAPSDEDNWAVPLYFARDIVNTGSYSWVLGEGLSEDELDETGQGFVVLVWFSTQVHAQSERSFTIADPCAYKSCGTHGVCGKGGRCECIPGYSGATCALGPCERVLCSSSYGSCLNEDYLGLPNVSSTTLGVCRCGMDASGRHYDGFQCRSPPDCTPKCKNGADLVNIVVDLNGRTDESKGQCGVCACMNLWQGDECETCGLQCFHGGRVDDQCSSCDCASAPGYFGSTCACKYYALTMQLHIAPSSSSAGAATWINNPAAVARFARTLATDLALAVGQVSGVNVQVNVMAVRLVQAASGTAGNGTSTASGSEDILEADVQFGLECPKLSAFAVGGSAALGSASTSSALKEQGASQVLGAAQATEGGAFRNLLSPNTRKDARNAAFFPRRAAQEVAALLSGRSNIKSDASGAHQSLSFSAQVQQAFSALSSSANGLESLVSGSGTAEDDPFVNGASVSPDVEIIDGRPSLLSVYNLFALALEDLSSPLYRGVLTSALNGARVTSARDLTGEDVPRVPGEPSDPFLSAKNRAAGGGGSDSGGSTGGLGVGGIVGIVVGGVVLLALLLALAAWLLSRHRRTERKVSYGAPAEQGGDGGVGQERMGVQVVPSEPASAAGSRPGTPPPGARGRVALGGINTLALREGQFAPSPSAVAEGDADADGQHKKSVSFQLNPMLPLTQI